MGKLNQKDATGRTVTLTKVRLSFGESLNRKSLPKKNKDPNAKPKHGANFILEKDSPDYASNMAAIHEALANAAKEFKKPENWWTTLLESKPDKLCLKKGDTFVQADGQVYKGYAGNMVLAVKGPAGGEKRPQIRDRYKKVIAVPENAVEAPIVTEIAYNGCVCDVIVSFYGTDNGSSDRLTGSVEAIRSWQEGERLGGGGVYVDDDDFDDAPDEDDSFDAGPAQSSTSSTTLIDL
jgi:hypothetical protein